MNKIKLSWSIISAWSANRQDEAIKMYLGTGIDETIHMAEGKRIHDVIAKNRLKLLPFIEDTAIFEDIDRENHKWVNYYQVEVFPWLDMSMIIDVLDPINGIIIDWKSGGKKSNQHNKMQLYIYAYLLTLLPEPIKIKRGIIGKVVEDVTGAIICEDFSLYLINDEKLQIAENYIESNASEIYNFLENAKNDKEK